MFYGIYEEIDDFIFMKRHRYEIEVARKLVAFSMNTILRMDEEETLSRLSQATRRRKLHYRDKFDRDKTFIFFWLENKDRRALHGFNVEFQKVNKEWIACEVYAALYNELYIFGPRRMGMQTLFPSFQISFDKDGLVSKTYIDPNYHHYVDLEEKKDK